LSETLLLFRRRLDQHIGEGAVGASVKPSTSTNREVKQRKRRLTRSNGHTNHFRPPGTSVITPFDEA
jgi:hypothetical protein